MMANGWQTVPFSDVLKVVSHPETLDRDKTYRILGMRWYAQGLFIREDKPGHEIQANELFRVEKDDFVYNRLFAWKGSFGIVDETTAGGYVSGEFPCFHVITEKADPKFIHLYLSQESIWNEIARVSSGQTNISRLRLKVPTFLAMEIPLPPLTEQHRIVARIEALAARGAESQSRRREASEETEAFLYSVLNSVFSTSPFPRKTVGELCDTRSGGTPSRTCAYFFEGDIPWIKSGELEDDFIHRAEEHITEEAITSSSAKIFPKGTLVVALYGATVGKTGVLEIDAATNHAVCALFPKGEISRDYLWWFLRAKRPEFLKSSFGGAQPNISQKVIRETEMPVPPLEKQRRLVAYLDGLQVQVSALRAAQAETEKELSALMPSVLDMAFKGEL
ncbi:MAG: restriction endonuclease subunit S [Anaerolineales bacterium]|nr:restriction endonuclease subunit S [Anaerolineales bacterium]